MKESQVAILASAPYLAKVMNEGTALAVGLLYVAIMCIHLFFESRESK